MSERKEMTAEEVLKKYDTESNGIYRRNGENHFSYRDKFFGVSDIHGEFRSFGRANSAGDSFRLRTLFIVLIVSDAKILATR